MRKVKQVRITIRSVMIRREICPIRAEILTNKHGEKLYISYLYDQKVLVSDKISSVYCLILEILGQKCHFFTI